MDNRKSQNFQKVYLLGRDEGFTIAELLITMLISALVLTGIYSVFVAQQKAHATNTQMVRMQQNLRAAMAILERDIRMAAFSPTGNVDVGFLEAREGLMQVTMDLNDDGDANDEEENISYGFLAADDANRDGILDTAGAVDALRRDRGAGGGFQPIANGIRAFAFAYAFDENRDGQLDTDASGEVIWAIDTDGDGELDTNIATNAAFGSTPDLDRIREVRIWLLARSSDPIRDYSNNRIYNVGRHQIAGNGEAFMLKELETRVKCRNMTF